MVRTRETSLLQEVVDKSLGVLDGRVGLPGGAARHLRVGGVGEDVRGVVSPKLPEEKSLGLKRG
jgi:hypothetical protein